ncbi:MAG: nuclear transport factor 2 family protein [Actinobacteria bacterium]|nr:nuclear transport factor 2 family protein [Actinomycetota bacterium]
MEVWELAAREEIRTLLATYAHGVDRGRFREVAELFVPDGILELGNRAAASGRDAIRAFLGDVDAPERDTPSLAYIRHHVSSIVIELHSRTSARAESYFFVLTDRGPDHWGRYRDDLVSQDGVWRFARRRARTDGAAPGSWAYRRGRPG